MTTAEMYADTRRRLTELFRSLSPEESERHVPATPGWSVADVARHLAGVADDVIAGRLDGAASDEWTAKQVEARRGLEIDAVLAEWDEKGPRLEAVLDAAGPAAHALVIDVVTHEQDVRGALARPGGRDTSAADWSLQQLVSFVDGAIRRAGLAPLRIRGGTDEWLVGGDGEPGATIAAEPYELLRAFIGRRSLNQLRSYAWEGDPAPYLPHLQVFAPAADDLTE